MTGNSSHTDSGKLLSYVGKHLIPVVSNERVGAFIFGDREEANAGLNINAIQENLRIFGSFLFFMIPL